MRLLLLTFLFIVILHPELYAQFAGGTGTEEDPYQIETVEQLQAIGKSENLDKHYVQTSDIDASETDNWNDGEGFKPIGIEVEPFSGSFDGQEYQIYGLVINLEEIDYRGLFSSIVNASIKNLRLVESVINGGDYVGGVAGHSHNSSIVDTYVNAKIEGRLYVGGIVGANNGEIINTQISGSVFGRFGPVGGLTGLNERSIEYSQSSTVVTGSSDIVGGLVGQNIGEIIKSSFTGTVSSEGSMVGGLVGFNGNSGTISDTNSEVDITESGGYTGGLVGRNLGHISKSYTTGNIMVGSSNVGGLAGSNYKNGSIQYSYANVNVKGVAAGGLVGSNVGLIFNSYANGSVTGDFVIGGLAGVNENEGIIKKSFSTGNVTDSEESGGLVGRNNGSVELSYWNSDNANQVNGTGSGSSKDVIGISNSGMTGETAVENFFQFDFEDIWLLTDEYPALFWEEVEALPVPDFGELAKVKLSVPENDATGIDIHPELNWTSAENAHGYQIQLSSSNKFEESILDDYSVYSTFTVQNQLNYNHKFYWRVRAINYTNIGEWSAVRSFLTFNGGFSVGNGTEENPFHIENLQQLQNIGDYCEYHFIQTADINATETSNWNEGRGFKPIGSDCTSFTGVYDGSGYTISGLRINRKDTSYVGLFSRIWTAKIRNVNLIEVNVTGKRYVGAIAGLMENNSSITNSRVSGELQGETEVGGVAGAAYFGDINDTGAEVKMSGFSALGGLVGLNSVRIDHSHATGDVSGSRQVGGLVGINESKISKSYFNGNVEGEFEQIGGLVGANRIPGAQVQTSYSRGIVKGEQKVGGLVGEVYAGEIINSYSLSTAEGNEAIGGLVGYIDYSGDIEFSYAAGNVTGSGNSGGLIGVYNSLNIINFNYWDLGDTNHTNGIGWVEGGKVGNQMVGLETDEITGLAAKDHMDNLDFEEIWVATEDYPALIWEDISVSNEPANERVIESTLLQNYPNPFNPTTQISYSLKRQTHVRIFVYNILGRQVATLVNELKPAGRHEISFDASGLSSGVYIYKLQTNTFTQAKQMMLVK